VAGLAVTELDHAVVYPTALFSKPVLCVQDYVQSLRAYCSKGRVEPFKPATLH
jgi:hypothetical protein